MFDSKKLAQVLFFGGLVALAAAVLWWAVFYGSISRDLGGKLSKATSCLYSGDGLCGVATGLAQMLGKTPYSPILFWVGALGLVAGALMKLTMRPQPLSAGSKQ